MINSVIIYRIPSKNLSVYSLFIFSWKIITLNVFLVRIDNQENISYSFLCGK